MPTEWSKSKAKYCNNSLLLRDNRGNEWSDLSHLAGLLPGTKGLTTMA